MSESTHNQNETGEAGEFEAHPHARHDGVVRVADGNDLDAVVAVGKAVLRSQAERGREPELVELLIQKFWTPEANVSAIRAGRTLVVEENAEVVAMLSYGFSEGSAVIWKINVLPDHAGHGHGRALIEACANKVAFDHQRLFMPIEDGNEDALRFALAMGFEEVKREEQSGMPDLIWMRKYLRRGEA